MSTPPPSRPTSAGFTITTPRLTLRTARPGDAAPLLAYLARPDNYGALPDLTPDALRARIGSWAARTAAGESAFMIVLPRARGVVQQEQEEEEEEEKEVIGLGGFNSLPRTASLNSGERRSDGVAEEEKVRAGDIGISFAAAWRRKGYAREAICAMTEFAFERLHCGYVHMDTPTDNEGFRALMRDFGIPEKNGSGVEEEDAVFKFAWKSVNYDWDRPMWERIKEDLKGRGKWPL